MKTEILRLDNVSLQMSGIMQLERFNLPSRFPSFPP